MQPRLYKRNGLSWSPMADRRLDIRSTPLQRNQILGTTGGEISLAAFSP
jgi:hypothetical protein